MKSPKRFYLGKSGPTAWVHLKKWEIETEAPVGEVDVWETLSQKIFLGTVLIVALSDLHQGHAFSRTARNAIGSHKHILKRRAVLDRQKRDWIIDTFTLQEELPGPYPKMIGTVKLEEGFRLVYKLQGKGVDEDPKGLFHINEDYGTIYVHQKIDFETTPLFRWTFNAINKTTMTVGTRLGIHLKIIDINDNAPEFSNKIYYVSVNESTVQGSTVFTMLAYDRDELNSPNSIVSYFLLSQMPRDPNVEFTIDKEKGFISFKGCLNYESNKKYKLVVEARDNGVQIQQSSSCEVHVTVLDRNSYPPMWSMSYISTKVPEHEANVTILRIGITDGDTPFTPAWRAIYSIVGGDEDENYKIVTDPKTNEGILTLVKPLDYENNIQNNLNIMVENEEPLYSCKVLQKTPTGLWVIDSPKGRTAKSLEPGKISVDIIDMNDAPIFKPQTIFVTLEEHSIQPGTVLTTVHAIDPDIAAPNKIKYIIENDTADWLSIDEDTGVITTKRELDRESDYVKKSKYIVTILALDNGSPNMTGIATMIINLNDINDNVPRLESPYLTTCENEQEAFLSTSIADKDLDPYSGPFYIQVLDKDIEKQHIKFLDYNDNVINIKKEKGAYQGNHTLHLEIYDRQGMVSYENLTVFVCDCLGGEVCVAKMMDPPSLSGGAIALLLLVPVLFLILCFLLCKIQTKKVMVPMENEPLHSIIAYNEEGGNKDCQASAILSGIGNMNDIATNNQESAILSRVGNMADFATNNQASAILNGVGNIANAATNNQEEIDGAFHGTGTKMYSAPAMVVHNKARVGRSNSMQVHSLKNYAGNRAGAGTFERANRRRHSSHHMDGRLTLIDRGNSLRHSANMRNHHSFVAVNHSALRKQSRTLETALIQKLSAQRNEREIYKPQVFAEEGGSSRASSLETISITGSSGNLSSVQNFGSKFNILGNICEDHMMGLPNAELSS
ncbi:cadherin-like protein 26 [Mixophyes fleayi]|uniref:cadherin-like protein 26 n=1 Tax=Mixophyes fleayi TaxID=3061075 RepID=UPI003F4E07FE